ncbi:MAG TPA: hypothetical protein VGL58_08530 [Caulobacteraceae bacterium]|jgi:hypothetical protein
MAVSFELAIRTAVSCIAAAFAVSAGRAAADTSSGPSLPDTMNYIRDKLLGYPVAYYSTQDTRPNGMAYRTTYKMSNVTISSDCKLSYDLTETDVIIPDPAGTTGTPPSTVINDPDHYDLDFSDKGNHFYTSRDSADEKNPGDLAISADPMVIKDDEHGIVLYFEDADTGNRVFKAVEHAVALCGGSNPDPFG